MRHLKLDPLANRNSCIRQSFNLGAASSSTATTAIDPDDRSLLPANDYSGYFRNAWQHRLRQKPRRVAVDVRHIAAVIGAMRRERMMDTVLNHWDEMVAYAALCCLVSGFNQAAPL